MDDSPDEDEIREFMVRLEQSMHDESLGEHQRLRAGVCYHLMGGHFSALRFADMRHTSDDEERNAEIMQSFAHSFATMAVVLCDMLADGDADRRALSHDLFVGDCKRIGEELMKEMPEA